MERWCRTNAIGSLHGRCRVHRAEILRLRGSCGAAETEALGACEELRPYLRREMGWPLSELGRIRLRRGDIEGAEEALLAAHRAGWDPQPGLALVRLAQGDVATAAASIRDALEHPMRVPFKERPPDTDLQRAPLLEAQVEIEIAAGDIARARSAADELTRVAARFESRALVAGATHAHGRVRLAEGAPADAERFCAEAARLWSEIGAPYEAALARAGFADALRASGSEQRAAFELEAARAVLDRIEAEPTADDAVSRRVTEPVDMFRREGDYWSVSFAGRTVQVRDLKGIRYLARLLADPGREFHVLDLVAAESGRFAGAASGRAPACRTQARRCRRDARRASQRRLPPAPRRDRGRHRAGARSRGHRARDAGRRRTRLPRSRALACGRPLWPRPTGRVDLRAGSSQRDPRGPPGDSPGW